MNIKITELTNSRDSVNKWMERYGVRFGVYKNGVFNEQLFPFDPVPRVISNDDWSYLEQGLKQRVQALNKFLWDVYHEKKIIKDGIVPEEFVYSSKGYMPECEQINPTGGVYAHIAGIDLVEGKDGQWYVLEDNLRIPSGASYPMIARQITRRVAPSTFASHTIAENRGYADLLRDMMDEMNDGRGISVILTPGRYNSAYFEHSYLAEKTGATLAYPGDLFVEDNKVYYSGIYKDRIRVGCIYRRVTDEYMDPLVFEASSLLGIPNVMQASSETEWPTTKASTISCRRWWNTIWMRSPSFRTHQPTCHISRKTTTMCFRTYSDWSSRMSARQEATVWYSARICRKRNSKS